MHQQLSCVGETSAPVRGRGPRDDTGDRPTVEDEPRSAGNSRDVGLQAQQSHPQQTAKHRRPDHHRSDAVLPRWLIAEPLQPSAVLVQPGRRALRPGQILLMVLASGPTAEDVPDTERQQAAQSQAFVLRR